MILKRYIGDLGEEVAVKYLKKNGYKIIERNFNTRLGEIDIIARDGGYICFVEVRLRAHGAQVSSVESVSYAKQRRLRAAAEIYIQKNRLENEYVRFDVVAITADQREGKLFNTEIEVIKNAF